MNKEISFYKIKIKRSNKLKMFSLIFFKNQENKKLKLQQHKSWIYKQKLVFILIIIDDVIMLISSKKYMT